MDEDTFWNDSIDALRSWRKKHPNYAPQLYKVQKTFEDMRIQHQKNMQQYFQKKSVGYFEQAEKIKHDAELIYKKISKLELLATLLK